MPKKFFDIIPPQESHTSLRKIKIEKAEKADRAPFVDETAPDKEKISEKIEERESRFDLNNIESKTENIVPLAVRGKKWREVFKRLFLLILTAGFLVVLIYGFRYYQGQTKVQIKIWPRSELLSLKEEIILDDKIKEPDFSNKLFPLKIFQEQKTGSQDFPSTGKGVKEEKAKGIIRVYNSFSDQTQPLLAQTRFVSADGKLFKSLKRVVIPGAGYEKNKLVPGSLDIEVQAAEPGEEYNIGPSTFSIPGFLGTAKYTAFYGKSFEPMKGGFRGQGLEVSSEDLDKARENLAQKLQKEGLESLKTKIPSDYILLEKGLSFEIIDESSSAKIGTLADSFNFKETIKMEVPVLKKTEIDKFVKDLISSNVAKDKKIEEKNIEINFLPKKKENGKLPVVLEVSVKILPELALQDFKKAMAGKSFEEINFLLKDNLQFSKIEIKPSFFWLRRIPENLNNIKIEIISPAP